MTAVALDQVALEHLPALARGCAILGTGGGGDSYVGHLIARQALEDHGPVDLIRVEDLPARGTVMPLGMVGAPTVALEKLPNGNEAVRLREHVEEKLGKEIVAIMASEIGGSNGVEPVAFAAQLGLPLLDADSMGRAFPEVHMVSQHVAGIEPDAIAISDATGNVVTLRATTGQWAERIARAVTVAFGGTSLMADYLLDVAQVPGAVVEGSVSRAIAIGRALEDTSQEPVDALVAELGAFRLLEGKIVDVERTTRGGFVRGSVAIEGTGAQAGRLLRLEIQNENLAAFEDGEVVACVPDLITVVDTQTGDAVPTELLRYGRRVSVLAFPCDPIWRTPRGLETVGPGAFGYDFPFVPVEELHA